MRIKISFPEDRDYAGRLEVLDGEGVSVLGPFPAAGRAHDQPAAAHGNALRDPLLPYGDTPIGTYAFRGIIESGPGTALEGNVFGVHGVVLLEPVSGPAALADAHGRFRLFIQGGGDDDDGGLRATAGAVRLLERDQKQLVELMRRTSERVLCEIITAAERGAKVVVTSVSLDSDPPVLPGRSSIATQTAQSQSAANLGSRLLMPPAVDRAARSATRFFVVPEPSGSGGGTGYGGGGSSDTGGASGGPGGDASAGASTTPDQPIATDSSPVTGVDLAPQQPVDVPGAGLVLTAVPSGLASQYPDVAGWLVNSPQNDPYTNAPATGGSLTSYVGNDTGTYTGTLSDVGSSNNYTGNQASYPYYPDAQNAAQSEASPLDASQASAPTGYIEPDKVSPELTPDQLAALVSRYAQYDAQLAASQADPTSNPSVGPLPQAGVTGVLGSGAYLPGFELQSVPTFAQPLGSVTEKYQGNIGEASFAGSSPLGGAFLNDLNTRSYTTASGGRGSPGFFPVFDYQNALTGNLTSVTTSVRGNINNPGDQARLDAYLNKYQKLVGSGNARNQTNLNTAAANLRITPDEAAARGFLAINADDVNAFRSFLAQDVQSNPDNYPAGLTPAQAANQIVSNNLTTTELVNLGTARASIRNLSTSEVQRLLTPEGLLAYRTGSLSGAIKVAGLRGGIFGAGVSTALQLGSMALSDQQYSATDYVTAGGGAALAGGVSGVIGGVIESAVGAKLSQSFLESAASGGEVGAFTPLLGRVAGGTLGSFGGAVVFQTVSMALSDQQYSTIDYVAKDTRAGVAGAFSGALAAGATFALAGSVAPGVGTAIGFLVGIAAFALFDYDFGDDIEQGVRSLDDPSYNDQGGFLHPGNDPSYNDQGGFLYPGF